MLQPLISVIVPCYNVMEYLPKCVESILSQTYKNLEIFLNHLKNIHLNIL